MNADPVRYATAAIAASQQVLDDAQGLRGGVEWWMNATPQQRAAREAEMAENRRLEREAAPVRELTMPALLAKLGFSEEYATHLVQEAYCTCGEGMDGWHTCEHARDLGLNTW